MQVKVPELLNKYVGETERNIRLVFQRARALADDGVQVVIFFDEMDGISGISYVSDLGAAGSATLMVAQLLSEFDELEARANVTVIGASSHADMIDPALLRLGRFGTQIYIGRPGRSAAIEILGKHFPLSLPYAAPGDGSAAARYRDDIINRLVNEIFDAPADTANIAEVTFESGHRQVVGFSQFLSGSALQDIAHQAKRQAAKRAMYGGSLAIEEVTCSTRCMLSSARLGGFSVWAALATGLRSRVPGARESPLSALLPRTASPGGRLSHERPTSRRA